MEQSTYTLNFWQRIAYGLVFCFNYAVSLLPLWFLYGISDCIYAILYYLIGYRKSLVSKNLRDSFPEKSEQELLQIERKFYRWLCDYFVETIKLMSISKQEMCRRMQFIGTEQLYEDLEDKRHITLYLGHYCNWEWITSIPLWLKGTYAGSQLYHPMENKIFDRLFLYIRDRLGTTSIDMKEAFQILLNWRKQGYVTITGYIADQVPGFSSMHYWPQFLNHDTPTYTGTERIARVLQSSVYYISIRRPKRGYYVASYIKICTDPSTMPKFAITERFYRLLENDIREHPGFWLWSHNRWKRTRADFEACYPDENERKRILSKL